MTGTLCQSAALGRSIAPWVAIVAALLGLVIKTIIPMVEKVGDNLHAFCIAAWPGPPGLKWPCLSPLLATPAQITEIAGVDRDVLGCVLRRDCRQTKKKRAAALPSLSAT